VNQRLDGVAIIRRDDRQTSEGIGLETIDWTLSRAPVGLLIIGMLGAPLLPAVQHHLGIHRVNLNLAPVVIGPSMPLALRLAANALLEPVRGWMNKLRWQYGQQRDSVNGSPQKSKGIPSSEQSRQRSVKRKDVETTVEYRVPAQAD
jgi:hypothetical protein